MLCPLKAEEIKGQFTCKVKTSSVATVDEGIFKEYSQMEDEGKVGSIILIYYEYVPSTKIIEFSTDLIIYGLHSGQLKWQESQENSWGYLKSAKLYISISDEQIFAGHAWQSFILKRYYKNDWSGFLSVARDFLHPFNYKIYATLGINCRHTLDKMDEIKKTLIRE